jgi:KipI family sensor histidine kinase inhibitor
MARRRIAALPYGPDAWLLHFAEQPGEAAFDTARRISRQLDTAPPAGLKESVPGYTTVLLEFDSPEAADAARGDWLKALAQRLRSPADDLGTDSGRCHDIPVRYDGPDLQRVAEHSGLTVAEVIVRHSEPIYRVALIGFAPGFPYLDGLDPSLIVPRLDQPRTRVEAGSVAIGGEHTGIYPLPGPGGWNLIGRTTVTLFDPDRAHCLLVPGDLVRFVVAEGTVS